MASSSTTPSTRPSTSRSTGKAPDRPASFRSTPAAAMPATADDTVLEAILRRDPARRRRVAIDADESHLLAALPLTDGLFRAGLAAWPRRRVPDGVGARKFLPGLLLVLDGLTFCRRHHEPVLDCRIGGVRPA